MGRAHFDPPTTARENVLSLPVSSLHNWLSCIRMYVDNDCPIVPRLWPFFGLWMTAVVRRSHLLLVSWTPRIIITPYHDVIHHGLSQGQIVVDGLSFHWALWPFLGDVRTRPRPCQPCRTTKAATPPPTCGLTSLLRPPLLTDIPGAAAAASNTQWASKGKGRTGGILEKQRTRTCQRVMI